MERAIIIIILVFFGADFNSLFAYDETVHRKICESAADPRNSLLNEVLTNRLGFTEGINTELAKEAKSRTIREWLAFGGEAEDYGYLWKSDPATSRAFNHFHDPLKDWDEAGLRNAAAELIYW